MESGLRKVCMEENTLALKEQHYLLIKESLITKIWNKVKVNNHVEEVIEFIEKN